MPTSSCRGERFLLDCFLSLTFTLQLLPVVVAEGNPGKPVGERPGPPFPVLHRPCLTSVPPLWL